MPEKFQAILPAFIPRATADIIATCKIDMPLVVIGTTIPKAKTCLTGVHKLLNITDGSKYGLTNLLYEKGATTDVCIRHKVDRKGLSVLPCGVVPPNPTELLSSIKVKQLFSQLKESYDFLIIDSPPVTVVTDAAILSQYTDGILFVVRQRRVTFEQARQAKRHLNTIDANILGVVINDFSYKYIDKSYSYYYHYY